jgi:pre-rRNA-processing protein TSR1
VPGEQDDLVAENEPDFMENEQTWPTEEELAEADGICLCLTVIHYTD